MPDPANTDTTEGCPLDGIDLSTIDTEDEELIPLLQKTFRCSGCKFGIREGHVHSCKRGHNMCQHCFKKYGKDLKCPKCDAALDQCRNFSLERILPFVPKPCVYQEKGCNFAIPSAKLLRCHEFECRFRPINCFFCRKEVMMHELQGHFEQEPDHEVIFTKFGDQNSISYTLSKFSEQGRGINNDYDRDCDEFCYYTSSRVGVGSETHVQVPGEGDTDTEEKEDNEEEYGDDEEGEYEVDIDDDEEEEVEEEQEEDSWEVDDFNLDNKGESFRCFVVDNIVFYFISRSCGPLWNLWAFADVSRCDIQKFACDIELVNVPSNTKKVGQAEADRVKFCSQCLSINRKDILDKGLIDKKEVSIVDHVTVMRNDILCLGRGAPARFAQDGKIQVMVTFHKRDEE